MGKKYRSEIAAAVHESMQDLHEIGLIDNKTMRHFDKTCLTPVEPLSPDDIARIREDAGVSQSVFATYLNVTPGVISKWERGEKKPQGPSLKLLTLVKQKGLRSIA
jgi:putative transcriptional regulator